MTLDETINRIAACAGRMDALYGGVVFDEWAIVSLVENKARIVKYTGPRNDDFLKNFAKDLGTLRTEMLDTNYGNGDFAFTRNGVGTNFEAFMVLGGGLYLICNNTRQTMDEITKDSRWLGAQVPFAELSDKLREDPLLAADTKFFTRSA
jgi:hypothetical protein